MSEYDMKDLEKRIAEVEWNRRKPIIRKVVIGTGVITGILLLGAATHAEGLEESLKAYLQDPSLDWLGHDFEKILFEESQEAYKSMKLSDEEFIAKLKFVVDDIKTLPLQAKCYWKIITQEVNAITYGSLGGAYGLKSALGGEEFAKMVLKIIKLGLR